MTSAGIKMPDANTEIYTVILKSEETETSAYDSIGDLSEAFKQKSVKVAAVNSAFRKTDNLTKNEKKAVEEGHQISPGSNSPKKTIRTRDLTRMLKPETEVVRYNPQASMDCLYAFEDSDLESLGVDTSGLKSHHYFEAAVGAVTARFYSQSQYKDEGIILPELNTD